jgi:phage protein D/phage baseplate assembly protein gpV
VPDTAHFSNVLIKADGEKLSPELYAALNLVRVDESVQLPDAFTIRFNDPHFELVDQMKFKIGSKIDIAFAGAGTEPTTVTSGEVTAISVEQGAGGRHELVLSGLDVTHRLVKGPKTRSFLQMTDADIVNQIADEHGFESDIDPTGEVNDYVLQTSQSDYAFLKARAERIGFDVWVSDNKLHFKQQPRAALAPGELRWGENLHKFKVRFSSSERCDEVMVRAWDPMAKVAIVGRATEGDLGTTAPAASEMTSAARNGFGEVSRFAGQFPVTTQAEADALAQSLLLKASGEEVVARGEASGDPLISAGATVRIACVGSKLSGDYRITSVEHVYGAGSPYTTRFVCGGKEAGSFADLMGAGGANGGQGAGAKSGWGSLVVGVVTNNEDADRLGRVKVKFPSLTDQDESTWAKVLAPGGGRSRGFQALPEVNDEVLVGFEHDDKHRPIVLGGLWNQEDPPPEDVVRDGKVESRFWTSRNGHRVALHDYDGTPGEILLAIGDGNSRVSIKSDESTVEAEQKLLVTGQRIEIEAAQSLVLSAPQIEISGSAEVKIAGGTVRIN